MEAQEPAGLLTSPSFSDHLMDHRLIEGLMTAIAPVIKDAIAIGIDKATKPLIDRIAALEARPIQKGEPGEPGKDGADGRDGIDGKDGSSGTVADVLPLLT